jgi:hypothetical protein
MRYLLAAMYRIAKIADPSFHSSIPSPFLRRQAELRRGAVNARLNRFD